MMPNVESNTILLRTRVYFICVENAGFVCHSDALSSTKFGGVSRRWKRSFQL